VKAAAPITVFANNPAAAVLSGGTVSPPPAPGTVETWTVSVNSFPQANSAATPPTQFHVVDPAGPSEIIAVTDVSDGGTTWTVTRGAESTVPLCHDPGFIVSEVVTASDLAQFLQANNGSIPGNQSGTTDWLNVRSPRFGAAGDGVTDDSAAFQAALNAAAAEGGGVLYIPVGKYLIGTPLTYSSSSNLTILGDSMRIASRGGTAIHMKPSSTTGGWTWLSVSGPAYFRMEDLSILTDASANSLADRYVAVSLTGVSESRLRNVHTATGAAPNRVNIGIVLNNCVSANLDSCDIRAYVNGLYITGTTAVIDVRATSFSCNGGSGVPGASCILMDRGSGTLHLNNVTTNTGDYGLVTQNGGTSSQPAFIFANDFEVNNPAIGGIRLSTGSQFWGEQCWLSDQGQKNAGAVRHGIEIDPAYNGFFYLHDSVLQHWSGHGVWIQGGTGYCISDCSFSGNGGNSPRGYDDLHVGASVSGVTIHGNHFSGVDPFNRAVWVRSGVYIEAGASAYSVTGNMFAAAGYGTSACVDQNAAATAAGVWSGNLNGLNRTMSAADPDTGITSWPATVTCLASASGTTTTSNADICTQTLIAGHTYLLEFDAMFTVEMASAGVTAGFDGLTSLGFASPAKISTGADGQPPVVHQQPPNTGVTTTVPEADTNVLYHGWATVTPNVGLPVSVGFASSVSGGEVTAQAGAWLKVQRIA
jgi:Pectate lyase superfamily protein/Right handed beta helix region